LKIGFLDKTECEYLPNSNANEYRLKIEATASIGRMYKAMIDGYMQIREKQVLKNFIRFEHIREE
jgi:hypothetical protein